MFSDREDSPVITQKDTDPEKERDMMESIDVKINALRKNFQNQKNPVRTSQDDTGN